MAGCSLIWWRFLTLFYVFLRTAAFNLDTSVPIVKEGSNTNAYFGFSVAQHRIYQRRTGTEEHVILIGAPKDNITHTDAPSGVRSLNKPGVIYNCPFTSSTDDCEQLPLAIEDPIPGEDRNDQWFGVSLSSQGTAQGMAVACAHRYKKSDMSSYCWGQGFCVSMSNALDEEIVYLPCENRPITGGHGTYGACQSGTSVALSKDDTDILVGVPGPYNWRGAIMKNIMPEGLESMSWYVSPVEDIPQGEQGPDPVIDYYSYMGMATAQGNIINQRKTYIAGAPRAGNIGEVLLFTEGSLSFLEVQTRLQGDQFGAGFGSSLAVVDLNNDRYEDLVVGAPFYYGSSFSGAIYIYMNGPQGITSMTEPIKIVNRKMSTQDCAELNCLDARFGHSLANVGDLDRDGFEDIAVGAPFEGNGAVYIFRGSENGIREKYSQRIAGSDLLSARPLTSFGYSLSGGNDMDGNTYPDVLVGAYDSNKAVVLRTRPVVNVLSSVQNYPEVIDPGITRCDDNEPNNCFYLRVCFTFNTETSPSNALVNRLNLDYKLEAEIFTGARSSRVTFRGSSNDSPHILEKSIRLEQQATQQFKCKEHYVYIKSNNQDFLNPIDIRLTYKLREQAPPTMIQGGPIPDFNSYPVLNEDLAKYDLAVHFVKNCGQDQVCQSDLRLEAMFELDSDDETGDPVYKIGQNANEFRLGVRVRNYQEDAHEATFMMNLPESIQYKNTVPPNDFNCEPRDGMVKCGLGNPLKTNVMADFIIRLDAKDISPSIRELIFTLRVNTTSTEVNVVDDMEIIHVKVIVETDMLVRSTIADEVYYGGEVRGESAIKKEEEIGSLVVHTYEVKNNGKGKVANSTVYISWPHQVHNEYPQGKHLLYMLEPPMIDSPGQCFLEPWMVNPIKVELNEQFSLDSMAKIGAIQSNDAARSRRKRQVPIPYTHVYDKGRRMKVVFMDCDLRSTDGMRSARCFKFPCIIGELQPGQSVAINIRARIWNSTFVEDYRTVDQVRVLSKATLAIDPALNIQQTNYDNDVANAVTIAVPDVKIKSPPSIPLWVIIVAALGGLLLLIIIIVLLWKCGFFKRAKPSDTRQYKGKVYKQPKPNDFDAFN